LRYTFCCQIPTTLDSMHAQDIHPPCSELTFVLSALLECGTQYKNIWTIHEN
jgi:hypothetical protein